MRKWTNIKEQTPTEEQKVYYFSENLGLFRGIYRYDRHSQGNPHKFISTFGTVDSDDISHWMEYDHASRDNLPLPPDYKNNIIEEIKIPNNQRKFNFTYSISSETIR